MNIFIGADHRGFHLKEILKDFLSKQGYKYIDVGNDHIDDNDDYPDFVKLVAESILKHPEDKGIVICRSGVGVDIVANKFKGIRAALISNTQQAFLSRNDDDTNILALSSEFTSEEDAKRIIEIWTTTPFSDKEKDKRRIEKIKDIEKNIKL